MRKKSKWFEILISINVKMGENKNKIDITF